MKTKILAILLALVLVLVCVVSCGSEGSEADTENKDVKTEALTDDETLPPPVTGGTMKLDYEISEGKLIVKVAVVNNPGIAGYAFKIGFDNTKLAPSEILDSDVAYADSFASNIYQNNEGGAPLEIVQVQYAQAGNITEDCVLAVCSFDILEGATGEVSFTLDASDVTNQDLDDMIFQVEELTVSLD